VPIVTRRFATVNVCPKRPLVLHAVVLAIVLAACAGRAGNALRDTAWELASLVGSGLLPGTTITLEFSGDQISGSAGCNQYGGSYETSGDRLRIGDVFATEMACLEPTGILEQEQAYLTALRAAASYQIIDARLEILDETGAQALAFVALDTELE
jgi:heat shock protein HslJ